MFLFPLCLLALFSFLFLCLVCFFSASSSSRPFSWPPPPLLPSFVSLASSFSSSLTSSSLSASLPLPSYPPHPSPVFLLVLLLFLSLMYPLFRLRRPFVLLLAFLLFLLLLVFDPLTLPVSPPLRSSSFLSVSAPRWYSSAHPLVCLSFWAGWTASVLSSSSSSPFSSSPVDFDSSLATLLVCLVFLVSSALMLSLGRFGSVPVFLPSFLPFHLMPLVLSPLTLMSSPPLFMWLPLL